MNDTTPDVPPRRRVLLAEDDASARKVLARVLTDMGLEVIEAVDGGRMLVAVTGLYKGEHTPDELDLVITDIRMPVLSGLEVLEGIRAAHWTTPVLVMTAQPDARNVRESVAVFDGILLGKPFDLDVFEATVRELLARPRKPSRYSGTPPAHSGVLPTDHAEQKLTK